jgi:hypothetical protein
MGFDGWPLTKNGRQAKGCQQQHRDKPAIKTHRTRFNGFCSELVDDRVTTPNQNCEQWKKIYHVSLVANCALEYSVAGLYNYIYLPNDIASDRKTSLKKATRNLHPSLSIGSAPSDVFMNFEAFLSNTETRTHSHPWGQVQLISGGILEMEA